jgi:hypothetical protein
MVKQVKLPNGTVVSEKSIFETEEEVVLNSTVVEKGEKLDLNDWEGNNIKKFNFELSNKNESITVDLHILNNLINNESLSRLE